MCLNNHSSSSTTNRTTLFTVSETHTYTTIDTTDLVDITASVCEVTTEKQQICGTQYHPSVHSFSFQSIKCLGNLMIPPLVHNKCILLNIGTYNCHIYIIIKTDKMICHSYQTSAYVTCKFMHYQCKECISVLS